ncbi:cuticle protein 19.8-like [Thrips palmi]|uniref:Cuticle protein 19.8-like n=1 Tax=Thrips palmi TaxID=161013 RepID=A0A6P8YE48_THRPL|nr:cuticle protein 19.8-like [Thrips palmi]
MKAFFALSCLVAVAYARPGVLLNAPLAWNGVSSYAAGTPLSSQYHAQDELGQYSYGYAGGPSSKAETRTADGVTRGSFSYVDSHGLLQSRSYVSDPVNGFRVAASDLPVGPAPVAAAAPVAVASPVLAAAPVHVAAVPNPVADTVEVAAAKAQHYAAHVEARARNGDGIVLAAAPVAPVAAPVAVATPALAAAPVGVAGLQSQYHAQDELGQYSYGYAGGLSAKDEHKTADGITRGSFSYVDAHGLLQSRSYVSDPVNGFRVAASDLPVGPAPVAAAALLVLKESTQVKESLSCLQSSVEDKRTSFRYYMYEGELKPDKQ